MVPLIKQEVFVTRYSSVIHYDRVSGKVREPIKCMWMQVNRESWRKKERKNKTGRLRETTIDHRPERKTKKGDKEERWETLLSGVTSREWVPVLYLMLSLHRSQSLLFIQRCNVWHFLRGEPEPLFSLAALSLAHQSPCIEMSAPCCGICSISFIYRQ